MRADLERKILAYPKSKNFESKIGHVEIDIYFFFPLRYEGKNRKGALHLRENILRKSCQQQVGMLCLIGCRSGDARPERCKTGKCYTLQKSFLVIGHPKEGCLQL